VHLKKRLPQKTVDALEKTASATVSRKREIERIDFCLRPIGIPSRVTLEQPRLGLAVRTNFLIQNRVLVAASAGGLLVLGNATDAVPGAFG
jgi:hypothetical protein